jgi:AcrR family transcriptional regulator
MAKGKSAGPSKQDAIVRAALRLFQRYGYRRTTVELIAREAAIAKPTLYAHFEDKDAVFVAVCRAVVDRILAEGQAAAALPDPIARVTALLSAKFTTVYELVESSPHARELLESSDARAHAVIDAGDRAFVALLVATLRTAARNEEITLERFGGKPVALAELLMQAAHGASWGATTVAKQRENLAALVRAILDRTPERRPARRRPGS